MFLLIALIAAVPGCWSASLVSHDCPRFCTQQYDPVCGTNGHTYSNQCFMAIATCQSGGMVRLAGTGSCGSISGGGLSPGCAVMACDLAHYDPVCGSDNQTYSSACQLHNEKCLHNHQLTLVHTKPCDDPLLGS